MATISRGYTFGATEQVTNAKLHALVDDAVISGIVNADIADGANIDFDKIAGGTIDGGDLDNLGNVGAGAGILPVVNGGTGLGACALGDMLYASATNVWARLARSTTATRYLANTGTSNIPQWDQVNLTNGVTGILPAANGGTGSTSVLPDQTGHGGAFLTTDGSTPSWSTSGSGSPFGRSLKTSGSGTWTCPTGVTEAFISMVGGGGGGGAGITTYGGGGGGGSGAWCIRARVKVTAGNSYAYTVGVKGDGVGAANGTAGTASTFAGDDFTITCNGGSGGKCANDSSQRAGGAGGTSQGFTGGSAPGTNTNTPGTASSQVYAGASGGDGGIGNPAGSGSGGANPYGRGGAGVVADTLGNNAAGYGGGGSGGGSGGNNRAGGNGGDGWIMIEY